jgi:opacity protein-like surface antigen
MTRSALTVLAATLLAAAAPLAAQPSLDAGRASSTKGFFIGANLNGSALSAEDLSDETENGGGLGLQLGYGFTPRLALVLDGTGARMNSEGESYTLGHFDIALRYAFTGETRRWVPFLEGGYSGRAANIEDVSLDGITSDDLSISGTGFTFGGGIQYYTSPAIALGVGLKWTTGEFDTVEYGGESADGLGIDATSARFNFGFTWYPMAGR